MSGLKYDTMIRAGHVFCAETGLDGPGMVAVNGSRIVASGPEVVGEARQTFEFPDDLVVPGLVDMHTHPGPPGWYVGVDAESHILARGTTTALSQGDAGADTWSMYRDTIIQASLLRIRMAISPVTRNTFAQTGDYEDLEKIDTSSCIDIVREGADLIWGISVNAAVVVTGQSDPKRIMRAVLSAAESTGCPLLFGSRREPSDWPLAEQLDILRGGDVMTYCLHRGTDDGEESIVRKGRVVDAVWEARERGVLFDVGHGMNSFDFQVAETAIAQGFLPDTISTDIQRRHLGTKPEHDMPLCISKLIIAGMSQSDALSRATSYPARILGLSGEIGTLAPGACADIAVLRWNSKASPLVDSVGVTRQGGCFEPVMTMRAGQKVQ